MTIRMSSGLRHAVITDYGVGRMMNGGYIAVYSGVQPSTADSPASGTLLARITADGNPPPSNLGDPGCLGLRPGAWGEIINDNEAEWLMTCVASGTPGWWRFYSSDADTGGGSELAYRIDGSIGESVFDIPTTVTSGAILRVSSFSLRFLP